MRISDTNTRIHANVANNYISVIRVTKDIRVAVVSLYEIMILIYNKYSKDSNKK